MAHEEKVEKLLEQLTQPGLTATEVQLIKEKIEIIQSLEE